MIRAGIIAIVVAEACLSAEPTFYRDVLPILQARCQECHRPGASAPMPFTTYKDTRAWAKAIRDAVSSRKMPPWFADPCCGKFSNDRSLTAAEVTTLSAWADSGASQGEQKDAPPPLARSSGWNVPSRDAILSMGNAFQVPARGPVEYQYFVVPTGFRQDRWVQAVEARPSAPGVVHHAVIYIRDPGSTWTRGPTKSDILTVYAPGASSEVWPEGMAKLIPAGADLVFEIHYTPNGKRALDRTQVALTLAKSPPAKRILTLQMGNDQFVIPPGVPDHQVTISGTLPNDALLLSLFPHMHLRGKSFEFTRVTPEGRPETLLKVSRYNFHWQLSYRLATPVLLPKGTKLQWIARFDNSRNNPLNPDPSASVRYGQQSWEEMMIGFFDVAVDADVDKKSFFVR